MKSIAARSASDRISDFQLLSNPSAIRPSHWLRWKNADQPERIDARQRQLGHDFPPVTSPGVWVAPVTLTTSPRLTARPWTWAVKAYQLMSANVAPASFKAIQVPPPGSGQREHHMRLRLIFQLRGAKAGDRVELFIPVHGERITILLRGEKVTVHMIQSAVG